MEMQPCFLRIALAYFYEILLFSLLGEWLIYGSNNVRH